MTEDRDECKPPQPPHPLYPQYEDIHGDIIQWLRVVL